MQIVPELNKVRLWNSPLNYYLALLNYSFMHNLYATRQRSQPVLVMNFRATRNCLAIHAITINVVGNSVLHRSRLQYHQVLTEHRYYVELYLIDLE